MNIESIRRDFDVFKKYVYLNTAVFSPLPKITIESIERYLSIRKYGITEIDEEDIINGAWFGPLIAIEKEMTNE